MFNIKYVQYKICSISKQPKKKVSILGRNLKKRQQNINIAYVLLHNLKASLLISTILFNNAKPGANGKAIEKKVT